MSLNSGALLSQRYRLLRLIATGGMGQVWEADDSVLDRHVAVKVLKAEYSSDPEFVERFQREAGLEVTGTASGQLLDRLRVSGP